MRLVHLGKPWLCICPLNWTLFRFNFPNLASKTFIYLGKPGLHPSSNWAFFKFTFSQVCKPDFAFHPSWLTRIMHLSSKLDTFTFTFHKFSKLDFAFDVFLQTGIMHPFRKPSVFTFSNLANRTMHLIHLGKSGLCICPSNWMFFTFNFPNLANKTLHFIHPGKLGLHPSSKLGIFCIYFSQV